MIETVSNYGHTPILVYFSIAISILTSFSAVELALSLKSPYLYNRSWWLVSGAFALGVGIWSMHFVGMLAFQIPNIDIRYHIPWVMLSMCCSIIACYFAFDVVSREEMDLLKMLLATVIIELGISSMHFSAMNAMVIPLEIHFSDIHIILSICLSAITSFGCVYSFTKCTKSKTRKEKYFFKISTALLLAMSFLIMHYLGKSELSFSSKSVPVNYAQTITVDYLSLVVTIVTFFIILLTFLASEFEKFSSKKEILANELIEIIKEKDDFISIASHELRTPITSLKLQYQMLQKDMEENVIDREKMIRMLKKSNEGLNKINELINQLIDSIRVSKQAFILNKEECSLNEIIENSFMSVEEFASRNANTFILQKSDSSIGHWDKFRLEQVFTNIIMNSIKYAPGSKIEASVIRDHNKIQVKIRDWGKGIPDGEVKTIFEKFKRGTSNLSQPGLGLGLYLVKHIIVLHEGTINVDESVKDGTQFSIILPIEI